MVVFWAIFAADTKIILRYDFVAPLIFTFKENHVFIEEEDIPSDKVVMAKEKLDDIDLDGIGNLVDLPRAMFIDKDCGNLVK